VAISTRLSVVVNLTLCSLFFLMGLLSDYFFRSDAMQPLRAGSALTGLFELAAVLLFAVGFLVVLFKYLNRYLSARACLIFLACGTVLWLVGLPFVWAFFRWTGIAVFGVMCVVALITYFMESKWFHWSLRMGGYAGAFLLGGFGAQGIGWLLNWMAVDFSGARIVLAKAAYYFLPNLQAFWVADLLVIGKGVNPYYVLIAGLYAFFHIMAFLFLAVMLFRERQLA